MTFLPRLKLFCLAMMQTSVIAINTWQIAHYKLLGSLGISFLISLIWTFNVKSVAFGDTKDRIIYSSGAALGTIAGMYLTQLFYG